MDPRADAMASIEPSSISGNNQRAKALLQLKAGCGGGLPNASDVDSTTIGSLPACKRLIPSSHASVQDGNLEFLHMSQDSWSTMPRPSLETRSLGVNGTMKPVDRLIPHKTPLPSLESIVY
ncbi:hypothetical protein CTAM01_17392, partial [Colletotrichum tamarilloi]